MRISNTLLSTTERPPLLIPTCTMTNHTQFSLMTSSNGSRNKGLQGHRGTLLTATGKAQNKCATMLTSTGSSNSCKVSMGTSCKATSNLEQHPAMLAINSKSQT